MKPILSLVIAGICAGICAGSSAALAQSSDTRDSNTANGVGIDAGENSASQSRASVTTERDAGQNSSSSTRAPAGSSRSAQDQRMPTVSPAQGRPGERDGTGATASERSSDENSAGRSVTDPATPARRASDGNAQ